MPILDKTGRLLTINGAESRAGYSSNMFVDKATGRLWCFGSKGILDRYFDVILDPADCLRRDPNNPSMTNPFTVTVEVWRSGRSDEEDIGTDPWYYVNKKEGTQSWSEDDWRDFETCVDDQDPEATRDEDFNGIANIAACDAYQDYISLYKAEWDGTLEIVNGTGSVENVRYKTDDDTDLNLIGSGAILFVGAEYNDD